MRQYKLLFSGFALWFLAACDNTTTSSTAHAPQLPKPGTVLLSVSEPIVEETLNKFTFSVKVSADGNVANGVYKVEMSYGPNTGEGKFTMPKGAESATPVIKKGGRPYTYIIGFKIPDDTTFYEYFEVSSTSSGGDMRYIKAYSF